MTFIDAALEILRREGTPLHAKVIAEKAVAADLLSHVGKTPEQTMSKRISAAVAKGKGPFVRVKPGVFGLEEWRNESGKLVPPGKSRPPKPPTAPAAHKAVAPVERAATAAAQTEDTPKEVPQVKSADFHGEGAAAEVTSDGDSAGMRAQERREGVIGSKKRSRGRRRGRSSREERKDERQEERPDERSDRLAGEIDQSRAPREVEERKREPRDSAAPAADSRALPHRNGSDAVGGVRPETRPENGRDRKNRDDNVRKSIPPERAEGFADQVETLLRQLNHSLNGRGIAERLRLSSGNAEAIVDSLVEADNLERQQQGRRARFVKRKNGWALSAREVPSEVVSLEDSAFDSAMRLLHITERQVYRRLKTVPLGKLAQLVILVLRQMGYSAAEPVSRGKEGEFHLKISDRRQGGNFATAVVIRKEVQGRSISDQDVSSFRGSLHHYTASRGLMITVGEVSPDAVRESDIPNLPPVGFMDGKALAKEMVRHNIGVEKRSVPLVFFDESWF